MLRGAPPVKGLSPMCDTFAGGIPRDEDCQRFIHPLDTYFECGWEPTWQREAVSHLIGRTAISAGDPLARHVNRRDGPDVSPVHGTGQARF